MQRRNFALLMFFVIVIGGIWSLYFLGTFEQGNVQLPATPKPTPEPVRVLVAKRVLFRNAIITSAEVEIRELRPEEHEFYEQNHSELLPADTALAHLKVPNKEINADTLLLRKDFHDDVPDPVTIGQFPSYRAVTVPVPKESSAGGSIMLGEFVDVLLTCRIVEIPDSKKSHLIMINPLFFTDGTDGVKRLASKVTESRVCTVLLAQDCRVILKRVSRIEVGQTDPPISFTMQANPYRVALIDYAQHKGMICLVPVPRGDVCEPRQKSGPVQKDTMKDEHEDRRVLEVLKGDLVVDEAELASIFRANPYLFPPRK